MQNNHGFTLIEVMVALVIFAVLSVTLLVRLGDGLRSESQLEEKTLASQVAENVLADLRIRSHKDWSVVSGDSSIVEMADRKWNVKTVVKDAEGDNLRQVDVQVRSAGEKNSISYVLTGFIGKN
jgi:general secretion pathway protein I